MGRFRYEASEGAAQYRRTLYAFWRRTSSPSFLFDSAQRRVCEVRLPRTNTPLHALALLNDENYLDAARALAIGSLRDVRGCAEPVRWLEERVLGRTPQPAEQSILQRELERARSHYGQNPGDARRLLARRGTVAPADLDPSELAARAVLAGLVLNLDEAMTHE